MFCVGVEIDSAVLHWHLASAAKCPSDQETQFKNVQNHLGALVHTLWRSVKLTTTPPVLNGDSTEPDNFHVRSLRGVITASAETCHQCTQNCRAECSTFGAMPVPSLRPKTALHCYVAVGLGSGLQTCLAMEIAPPLKRMLYPLQSWVSTKRVPQIVVITCIYLYW